MPYFRAVLGGRYRFREVLLFAGQHIYKNRIPCNDFERMLDEYATNLLPFTVLTTIFVLLSFTFILFGPVYVFFARNEYAVPTGVILPFLDASSGQGFLMNILLQGAVMLTASTGFVCIENMFCVIGNTYSVMTEIICFNMREFSGGLRAKSFSYQQKMQLRNVFVQLQDLEGYFIEVNDLYYWKFFLQPITTTVCVAIAVFSQKFVSYVPAPGVQLNSYTKINEAIH